MVRFASTKSHTAPHRPSLLPLLNEFGGPIRGFRDTGYSRKKLPGYGIFEEKVIGIQDTEK